LTASNQNPAPADDKDLAKSSEEGLSDSKKGTLNQPGLKLNIVLFQPEIPGNTGAVGRTCVALGAKLWLVRPLGFRVDEKTLRRAGLDYWQHLDWEVADHWDDLLERLKPERIWFFTRFATQTTTVGITAFEAARQLGVLDRFEI